MMTPDPDWIGVVGAGAVGSIVAACLLEAGRAVALVESSPERLAQIRQSGLEVAGALSLGARPPLLLASVEALGPLRPSSVLLATKAWSLRGLLPALARVLPPGALVVGLQNGLGVGEELASRFPGDRVGLGIVNCAGNLEATGRVRAHLFATPSCLGPLEESARPGLEPLARALDGAGLPTGTLPAAETPRRVFFKAILSSALNALCAASGFTMGQALRRDPIRRLARRLVEEGLAVGAALGHDYGNDARTTCLGYLEGGGDHLPSMWSDLRRGHPTEIEYINGRIAEIGLRLGLERSRLAANLFLTSLIVREEIRAGSRRATDLPACLASIAVAESR
jgi:2-dehydropantoate 2-reductase